MRLENEVRIARPPAEVFDMLLDVRRVAGCMPGSTLTGEVEENTYAGEVKVKVGPLGVAYTGTVRFLDVRRDEHAVELKASGKEKSGQGNADAHVVARVSPDGDGSRVSIETDLTIRGKVAQFGRGVIGEVSQRLISQFASNVERELAGEGAPAAPAAGPTPGGSTSEGATAAAAPTGAAMAEPAAPAGPGQALDGLGLVAGPLIKRFAPVAAGLAAGILIGAGLARRRRGGHTTLRLTEGTAYLLAPLPDRHR